MKPNSDIFIWYPFNRFGDADDGDETSWYCHTSQQQYEEIAYNIHLLADCIGQYLCHPLSYFWLWFSFLPRLFVIGLQLKVFRLFNKKRYLKLPAGFDGLQEGMPEDLRMVKLAYFYFAMFIVNEKTYFRITYRPMSFLWRRWLFLVRHVFNNCRK